MPKLGKVFSNIKNNTVTSESLEVKLECSSVKNSYTSLSKYYSEYNDYIQLGRLAVIGQYVFFLVCDAKGTKPPDGGSYNYSRYQLIKYDTENNSFQILNTFYLNNNENLRSATLCTNDKNAIYIFGAGTTIRKFKKENNWAIETITTRIPRSVSFCSVIKIDNYIYLLGGGSNKIEKFNINTESFESFDIYLPFNIDKSNGICSDNNGNIFIIGNISYKFDTKTNEISNFKTLNSPKNYNGLSYIDGFLYSYSTDSNFSIPTSYIERLDLSDDLNEWEIITDDNIPNGMGLNYSSYPGFLYTEYKNEVIVFGQSKAGAGCFRHRFGENPENIEIRYNITSDGTEPEEPTETTEEVTTGTFEALPSAHYDFIGGGKNAQLYVIEGNIYIPATKTGVRYYSLLNRTYNSIETSTYVMGIINLGDYFLYTFATDISNAKYMQKINTKTRAITNLTQEITIPVSSSYSYTAIGSIGYIIAGQSIYKLEDDVLSILEDGTIPVNISGGYAVSDKNKYIYMYGRNNTQGYRYNTETREFVKLPDFPYTYTYFALNVVGNYLYYIGGGGSGGSKTFKKLNLLELTNWENETSLLKSGARINSCVYENYIYSITGFYTGSYPDNYLYAEQFWRYMPVGQVKKTRTGIKYSAPITVSEVGEYKLKTKAFKKI